MDFATRQATAVSHAGDRAAPDDRWNARKIASRAITIAAATLVMVVAGCNGDRAEVATVRPEARPYAARIDSLFGTLAPDAPGCAVAVYQDGDIVFAKGYGVASMESGRPLGLHTAFNLGSASKPYTAIAVLRLVRAGRLSLDDDIRRHLPELRGIGDTIRVRDLLYHTSGLRDFGALDDLTGQATRTMPQFLARLAIQRLNFRPGTQHEYSHSDFLVLAALIERLTGEPFGVHLEREVLKPLGMDSAELHDARGVPIPERALGHERVGSAWRVVFPESELIGGSNVYASLADLAAWDHALASGTVPEIATLLTRPTLASGDTIPYAYGLRLGTYRGLRTVVRGGHDAGMFSEFLRFPDERTAVAVLCNAEHLVAGLLAQRVGDIVLAERMEATTPLLPPPPEAPATLEELQRYTGTYRTGPEGEIARFVVHEGKLAELLLSDTMQTMTHRGDGLFTGDGSPGDFRVKFSTAVTGVMQVEYISEGEVIETLSRLPDDEARRLAALPLGEYAGSYYSAELGSSWSFIVTGGDLVLRRPGTTDVRVLAMGPDRFTRIFGSWNTGLPTRFAFARDRAGRVTGFSVTTPPGEDVVRDLRFERLPPARAAAVTSGGSPDPSDPG